MAPKTSKGKGVAKDTGGTEPTEGESAARRVQLAYCPSTVDAVHLQDNFKPLWGCNTGGESTGHPTTCVIPADCAKAASNRYHSSSTTFHVASTPFL